MAPQTSADANVGLHQLVNPFGEPQQAGAVGAVQRELVASVQHGMAQLREAALDEPAVEEPEATQSAKRVVIAQRDQCAEIAVPIWWHLVAIAQPRWQMPDQMQCLLACDLRG